jgi:hypothetical protein
VKSSNSLENYTPGGYPHTTLQPSFLAASPQIYSPPDWIERLLGQPWSLAASLQVDRYLDLTGGGSNG